jgi:Phosphatidylinositol-specific phospholipase C, Y domain/Phosphatidylinositol-specific phospholipase C, X domain
MVRIMNECFQGMLCSAGEHSDAEHGSTLPTVDRLKNKILVKVKYSPPLSADATAASSSITRLQSQSDADSASELSVPPDDSKHHKTKIIDALSKMATYVRGYHFSDFRQPEAKVPTHVFSLSESALLGIYKADPEALFAHNKEYLMRAYPKGTRIASSNLDPSQFWRLGVQMVALNWQSVDKGMMLQHAMFSGTGGWVRKPESLASSAQYEAPAKESGSSAKSWLSLTILAGQCLPLPPTLDNEDKLRPYIKCEVHIDTPPEEPDEERKSKRTDNGLKKLTRHAKGSNPKFGNDARLFFEGLPALTPALSFLRYVSCYQTHDVFVGGNPTYSA